MRSIDQAPTRRVFLTALAAVAGGVACKSGDSSSPETSTRATAVTTTLAPEEVTTTTLSEAERSKMYRDDLASHLVHAFWTELHTNSGDPAYQKDYFEPTKADITDGGLNKYGVTRTYLPTGQKVEWTALASGDTLDAMDIESPDVSGVARIELRHFVPAKNIPALEATANHSKDNPDGDRIIGTLVMERTTGGRPNAEITYTFSGSTQEGYFDTEIDQPGGGYSALAPALVVFNNASEGFPVFFPEYQDK